jgi:transglutaminase-like putative cysteine protease
MLLVKGFNLFLVIIKMSSRISTMWLRTSCDLAFDIIVPTPFVLMLRPRSGAQQWISVEEYKIEPSVPAIEFTDGYGNLCQRLIALPGRFSVHTAAEVMTADQIDQAPGAPFVEVQNLPDSVLNYLLPSRFCESDRFSDMALSITDGQLMGYDQVSAISNWIKSNIRYEPESSEMHLSATEVNSRQWGVCRDFAHLGIAMCRSLCIPARMVVGYLYGLQPMDLHAWFEAYVGDRWYAFDATQAELRGGYVAIGYGRDAADVAVYNQFGPALCLIEQQVRVQQIKATTA